jgi:dodecin
VRHHTCFTRLGVRYGCIGESLRRAGRARGFSLSALSRRSAALIGTGFDLLSGMAKKSVEGVYRVTEIIGTSSKSWEDAAKNAVETAAESLRDLRIAEVSKLDMKIENGKVVSFRARVSLSFKYEG